MTSVTIPGFALAMVFVSLGTGNTTQSASEITVAVALQQRSAFVQGEPLEVTIVLSNDSLTPIIEPAQDDWEITVVNSESSTLADATPPGQPRQWVPPELGGSIELPRIESGDSREFTYALQNRFRIIDENDYNVTFAVAVKQLNSAGEFTSDPPVEIETTPFSFQVDSSVLAWELDAEPLVFHVVDEGGTLTLRYYRVWRSPSGEVRRFGNYQVVDELEALVPTPEVTSEVNRFGVRYSSTSGDVCAVVEVQGHLVVLTPPSPFDVSCPP